MLNPLPVDDVIGRIVNELQVNRNVVLEAPPGAGKTTRVPPALLGLGAGEVVVLEPRRLAARMAARRVAAELGDTVGGLAGYQVRFEDVSSARTRLRFVTEGVLTRRLLRDPELRGVDTVGVDTVVLDEFHERHLDGDFALALLRRLQLGPRPELRLVVMSATLDTGPVAEFLGGCSVVRSEGRLFPVDVLYAGASTDALEQRVASAVAAECRAGLTGDVLVFLPGAAEIRRALRACEGIARAFDLLVLPLYGDLSPEEQDRAVQRADRRKVILSTNVAESSITIDGVTVVIDSGLARIASDSPWTGLPTLEVRRVSQASASQRAGRAGRTGAGRVVRLYSAEDFQRRERQEAPEITRRELSQLVLDLRALGLQRGDGESLDWLTPPPDAALLGAETLLEQLGAGRDAMEMARYPVHPRLARFLMEAGAEGCVIAAWLSSGERLPGADVLAVLEGDVPPRVRQLAALLRRRVRGVPAPRDLRIALLKAFPDRVGRLREKDGELCSGRFAQAPAGWKSEFFVAVEMEDRRDGAAPLIRAASPIEPEWLLDFFPERVRDRSGVVWNRTAERAESVNALLYDELVIEESRSGRVDAEAASMLLAERALEAGVGRFIEGAELEDFLARVSFAAAHSDAHSEVLSELTDADVAGALRALCEGERSFAGLRGAVQGGGLVRALEGRMPPGARAVLDAVAPERVALKGRQVKVRYVRGQSPWIASRLQDFFGLRDGPRVGRQRDVPVLLHLLAPNGRPVQMTTDLAGFWARLYPQVRRELCRRYPKHAWPENPLG